MWPKTQNVNEVEENILYELNRARVEPQRVHRFHGRLMCGSRIISGGGHCLPRGEQAYFDIFAAVYI